MHLFRIWKAQMHSLNNLFYPKKQRLNGEQKDFAIGSPFSQMFLLQYVSPVEFQQCLKCLRFAKVCNKKSEILKLDPAFLIM